MKLTLPWTQYNPVLPPPEADRVTGCPLFLPLAVLDKTYSNRFEFMENSIKISCPERPGPIDEYTIYWGVQY